jgi:enamine deaminase RidA (YjgF/YER057c/UK114 family)
MDIAKSLADLGWMLPPPPKPIAIYVPSVKAGSLVFVSGQLPLRDGKLVSTGKVPSEVSIQQAQQAAAQCAVNRLAIVSGEIGGDWQRLVRVVRLGAFVHSDDDFTDQAKVANGARELLGQVLGDAGKHARSAVGVNTLPLGASVEVEFIFEIR